MPLITQSRAEMVLIAPGFADLLLTGKNIDVLGNTFNLDARNDDLDWGQAEPIDVEVQRWMADGAIASTQGEGNRTLSFQVQVSANDPTALAAGEAALALRQNSACLLKWVGPAGSPNTPASVFEVWTWHLKHEFDDTDERHLSRAYLVTMTAKPGVRSEFPINVAAVPTSLSPTVVSIDACTSAAIWSSNAGAVATTGTAVQSQPSLNLPGQTNTFTMIRTASTPSLVGTFYLALDMSLTGLTVLSWAVYAGASAATKAFLVKVGQIGTVSYYQLPAGTTSFGYLEVDALCKNPSGGIGTHTGKFKVSDVSSLSALNPSGFGTAHQQTMAMGVGGSKKTAGSLLVASPNSTGLGQVLVHTRPDDGTGLTPPLRQYRTAGNALTPDATAVSGQNEAFLTSGLPVGIIQFTPPVPVREATYALVGRFRSSVVQTMQASILSFLTGQTGLGLTSTPCNITFTQANVWTLAVLGALSLPSSRLPPESQLQTIIDVSAVSGTGTVVLDEVWLLDITYGDVTIVDCGSATRLWLDAPDAADDGLPSEFIGTQDDRSDAAQPAGTSMLAPMGNHEFDPSGNAVFAMAAGVSNALVSLSAYQRWHTHAAA